MNTVLISLPAIAVIGKEGLCTKEHNRAPELWAEANAHFEEVAPLGMVEKSGPHVGAYVGFWGLMSDKAMRFLPWEEDFSTGLYLAGIEVVHEAQPPAGWVKWEMPPRSYLVAEVTPDSYGEVFRGVLASLPEQGLRLCGAVCDYTEPATGQAKLFFPVERL